MILVKGIDEKSNREARKLLCGSGLKFTEKVDGRKILNGDKLPIIQAVNRSLVHHGTKGLKEFLDYIRTI